MQTPTPAPAPVPAPPTNRTLPAGHRVAFERSGTTTMAAVIAYIFGALSVLSAILLWAARGIVEDLGGQMVDAGGSWVPISTVVEMIEVFSLVFFVIGVVWCVFAGLLRHGTLAGWIGLLVLGGIVLVGNIQAGRALTSVDFWLSAVMILLLLTTTTREDCGLGSRNSRLEREQRYIQRVQDELRAAEYQPASFATNPYEAPSGSQPPHPRAYWDPTVQTWVRWEPQQQTFLRHDPVSNSWRTWQ